MPLYPPTRAPLAPVVVLLSTFVAIFGFTGLTIAARLETFVGLSVDEYFITVVCAAGFLLAGIAVQKLPNT